MHYRVIRDLALPESRLFVEVRVDGSPTGSTRFGNHLAFGPTAGLDALVLEPTAWSNSSPLALAREDDDARAGRFSFRVDHAPSVPVTLRYQVGREFEPRRASTAGLYRPYLDERAMHLIGHLVFLSAEHLGNELAGKVEFVGFDAPDWDVRSSLRRLAPNTFEFRGATERNLHHAVFVAGPDVSVTTTKAGHSQLTAAALFLGRDAAATSSIIGKLSAWQRRLFHDESDQALLVTMLGAAPSVARGEPLGNPTGVGLENGFAAYVPVATEPSEELIPLIAHELAHHWLGPRLLTAKPGEASWFWEGFATFYAPESLHRLRLIDTERYVELVNRYVVGYQENVFRHASNEEVARVRWEHAKAHKLFYDRGAVQAALLNRELRVVSGGKQSLDDFVREAVSRAKSGPLTNPELFQLVEQMTSKDFRRQFERTVIKGWSIEIPADLLGPEFELETRHDVVRFRRTAR